MTTVNQLKGRVLYYRQANRVLDLAATLLQISKVSTLKSGLYAQLAASWNNLNKHPSIQTKVPADLPKSKYHVFVVLGSGLGKGGKITGKYLRRLKLAKAALEAGQIDALKWPPNLYSEDLW